ncbi:unnamed protein product [Ixodes hexagonus]
MAFFAVVVNNLLVETLPLQVRITFGYLLSFGTLLFVAVFEIYWDAFDHDAGYRANLIAVAVVALGCTVQQSSFYGYTSMLPSRYTQAVMTGESAAGVLVSASRILTKALLSDERINTLLFFSVSVLVVLLCFVVHGLVLQRTRFVRFYLALCAPSASDPSGEAFTDDLLHKRILLEPTEDVGLVTSISLLLSPMTKTGPRGVQSGGRDTSRGRRAKSGGRRLQGADEGCTRFDSSRVLRAAIDLRARNIDTHSLSRFSPLVPDWKLAYAAIGLASGRRWLRSALACSFPQGGVMARVQVARTVWPYMLSIALAYFVTLSLFPGIESEIVSCRLGSWMPVLLMALFNAADFFGKVLASIRYDWSRSQLVWMSSCRIVLVPLMALCAVPSRDPVQNASVPADVWAMVLSVLLGVTNGVFGSVPMIVAPSRVPDDQKELTGNIMTLSYSLGLTTGSGVAYLIEYLIGWTHTTSHCTAEVVEATVTWASLNETISNFSTTALASVTSLLGTDNVTSLSMSL